MTLHAPGVASAAAGNEFDGHAPVYRQIALILRERMGTRWRAGDELPSEGDLASEFGVNRNTLRRAIGVLVEEGVLERRRGVRLRVARLPGLDHPKLEADPTQLFRMRPGTKFKVLRFEAQPLGPYALQAAIAACHARAPSGAETYWKKIVALYDALAQLTGSPVVELNRAVAVSMAFGAAAGLELVDALVEEPALRAYHLLPSVRGDLLMKLGRTSEARAELERAASLAHNTRERELLLARARACVEAKDGSKARPS